MHRFICKKQVLTHVFKVQVKSFMNVWIALKPLPDDKIVDRSKLKQVADDILKCI